MSGPAPKPCIVCGVLDNAEDHRDEENYRVRCPVSENYQRIEPVMLREYSYWPQYRQA